MNFRNISLLSTRNYVLTSRKLDSLIFISLLLLTLMFSARFMTGHEVYGATTCANLPISAVKANGAQTGNPASEAVDNDATTRWSNEGLGSWIRLDLGSQKTVCSVNISWYNGNQRQNTFEIAVSNDGNTFTKIFSGKSSGTTTAAEKYDVTDSQGRYVKITVTDNTQSDWISITEIDVVGGLASSDTTPPNSANCDKNAPISAFTANGAQTGNPASSAVDNSLGTRWSNQGIGSWIRLDLGSEKTVCSVDVNWFKGNERVNSFDVLVSNDGNTFTKIFSGKSSGTTTATEKYNVPDTKGRFVRITFTGNTVNDWVSINEIDVFSTDSSGTTTNHNPAANNQNVATTLNTGKSITLTASDSDGDKLTYSIVKQPSHGTLTGTPPSVTYKPASDYTGSDSFTFKVNDGRADSNTATISISISSTSSGGKDKF